MTRYTRSVLVFVLLYSRLFAANALIRGIVHDPQHRPIAGASVTVRAVTSDWAASTQSGAQGDFTFPPVPVGDYKITVAQPNFETTAQTVTVTSGAAPVLHFQLALATVSQTTEVTGAAETPPMDSATPTTLIDREDIALTPGADRTNSMAMITDFTPGRLRDPRHAAHARRPSNRLADRRRAHSEHQYRHQSGPADRPQGHRLSGNPARQLRRAITETAHTASSTSFRAPALRATTKRNWSPLSAIGIRPTISSTWAATPNGWPITSALTGTAATTDCSRLLAK